MLDTHYWYADPPPGYPRQQPKCSGMSGMCTRLGTRLITDKGVYVTALCAECFDLEFAAMVTNRYPPKPVKKGAHGQREQAITPSHEQGASDTHVQGVHKSEERNA